MSLKRTDDFKITAKPSARSAHDALRTDSTTHAILANQRDLARASLLLKGKQ